MKKLFALLIAAACLFSLGTAALAEGEEMVPVCVSVPEGWEAPCLWAWADDGTNAFAAWPARRPTPWATRAGTTATSPALSRTSS